MNILVAAPYGMYHDFSSSFIHNQLKEMCRLGCNVTVLVPVAYFSRICTGRRAVSFSQKKVLDGVEIYFVSYLSLSSIGRNGFNIASAQASIMLFVRKNFKDFLFDIIWVHTFGLGEKIGYTLKQRYKKPLILTTHGGDTERFADRYVDKKSSQVYLIDEIIAVSSKLSKKLENLQMGVPIRCIENGFCTENLVKPSKGSKRVIQVGHLIESKHYEITLEAVGMVRKKGLDIDLDIVGEGPWKRKLEALVEEKGLGDCVTFHGQLDNREVMHMMAGADFFVMPSYPEGLGIVYLEAMGEGCITIGTKGEGIDGIIRDGENGFLVERDDPLAIAEIIETCVKDRGLCRRISEKACASAAGFSWEKNAGRNLEVIRGVKAMKI